MSQEAIGLDVGGANLKAATSAGWATTRPFELWKYPVRLAAELARLPLPSGGPIAVTLTGELCDCFATKRDGVRHILAAVSEVFPRRDLRVWSTAARFVSLAEALDKHMEVAGGNWLALATFAGRFAKSGPAILIDCGSTTTDIVPLMNGVPNPVGMTDQQRLRTGELVYTGVRRTPVCALLSRSHGVAAELFATMFDAYLIDGASGEDESDTGTADGRPATKAMAHARLARMLGGDAETVQVNETVELARLAIEAQATQVGAALKTVSLKSSRPPAAFIYSGSGEFLARRVVSSLPGEVRTVSLAEQLGPAVSSAACAYALAVLRAESRT